MARKKRPWPTSARALLWLAVSGAGLFTIAEIHRFTGSERGQLTLARHLGLGNPARIQEVVGRQVGEVLTRAGVPPDSIRRDRWDGKSPVAWRVGLPPDASLLQLNYRLSQALGARGVEVLSGEETWPKGGAPTLRLELGLPRSVTHTLQIVRARTGAPASHSPPARLALVLYGWGENPAWADSFFALPIPFGVALAPGLKTSRALFRAAHARSRELVLHLPLEPIDYPRINPGPGTLLVTMSPSQVSSAVRRYLGEAAPVAAVANQMGSLATQDMNLMRGVYHELRRDDLPFLHVTPASGAVCRSLAAQMGITYAEPGEVVDGETLRDDTRALEKRWREVLERARARRDLIVWLRATPLSRRWLLSALAPRRLQGVSLVPLATLVRKPAPL